MFEDEEPLQEIVHDALKEGGFDVMTVAFGREPLAMVENGAVKCSALVTDGIAESAEPWRTSRRYAAPPFTRSISCDTDLLPLSTHSGRGRARWRLVPVANDP